MLIWFSCVLQCTTHKVNFEDNLTSNTIICENFDSRVLTHENLKTCHENSLLLKLISLKVAKEWLL